MKNKGWLEHAKVKHTAAWNECDLWVEATGQHFPTLISKGMAVKFVYGTPGSTKRDRRIGEEAVSQNSPVRSATSRDSQRKYVLADR